MTPHLQSTVYLLGEDGDEGRERENKSDDLARKKHVEQGLLGYFAGMDIVSDGERVSEKKNKESRADNEDGVDLQEVTHWHLRWTGDRSNSVGEVFWVEIVDGYPGIVFVEILGCGSGQNVHPGWSSWQNGGDCRNSVSYSIFWVTSRNKSHHDPSRR